MNRLLEGHGPDAIVSASEALLDSDRFDMAIARHVFEADDQIMDSLYDESREHDIKNVVSLTERLEQLYEVNELIVAMWAKRGYNGMYIEHPFHLDQVLTTGCPTHMDKVSNPVTIEAGIQLSLCLRGRREFSAERIPGSDVVDKNGALDVDRYNQFAASFGSRFIPRTSATVEAGDVVLFPHHPEMTAHGVSSASGYDSIARLITYRATQETPLQEID